MNDIKILNLLKAALIAIVLGMTLAFLMSSIAIIHNPRGEFFVDPLADDLEYDLFHLGLIWASWFLPVFLIVFGVFTFAGLAGNNAQNNVHGNKFYSHLKKLSPKIIWGYTGIFSALVSSVPATLLYITAIDPGHYRGQFCLENFAEACRFDFIEITFFWFFWFLLSFLLLFPTLGWFLVTKTKK